MGEREETSPEKEESSVSRSPWDLGKQKEGNDGSRRREEGGSEREKREKVNAGLIREESLQRSRQVTSRKSGLSHRVEKTEGDVDGKKERGDSVVNKAKEKIVLPPSWKRMKKVPKEKKKGIARVVRGKKKSRHRVGGKRTWADCAVAGKGRKIDTK